MGSPRKKGNTYHVVERIKERLLAFDDSIEFEYLFLKDCDLKPCTGCFACIAKGESLCPLKDDRDMIMSKMMEADGIIFAAPCYGLGVPAVMKNFIDRFSYTLHRPRFFDKCFLAVATVGGVMGYEGHAMLLPERDARASLVAVASEQLAAAHAVVGGDVVSTGGTGTYDLHTVATEIQAGSYALMDTAYAKLGLPFGEALSIVGTVVSTSAGYAVADVGLKALGMDHGNSSIDDAKVWFFSDEHVTFAPERPIRRGPWPWATVPRSLHSRGRWWKKSRRRLRMRSPPSRPAGRRRSGTREWRWGRSRRGCAALGGRGNRRSPRRPGRARSAGTPNRSRPGRT
jgi:multimeric flavodoxin WrbA